MRVSVIGGSSIDDETAEVAREVGRLLGERGHTLVCGGLGGVMAPACEGAREAERSEASEWASGRTDRREGRHASREAERSEASERASGGRPTEGRPPNERAGGGSVATDDTRAANSNAETIGILPTTRRADANEWVTTPIATGLGNARNPLVVLNGDAVIAIDGAAGTLSELGHALDHGRPVAGLDTHDVDLDGFRAVETPLDAVEFVESAVDHR